MRKSFLILLLLFGGKCFSQAITVDSQKYSVPELVTDVLIRTLCVPVTNISWSTGTDFGSSNGIGYFENKNPSFPLSSGVILSTGNATNSIGPNTTTLDDGNIAWLGDKDLEKTLLGAGIKMNSTNATVLEFDFVSFSSNFDFSFIFASEEYGNFQCEFSDSFAFLLTNKSTGVTTNLAVVPSTTTPISVVTIRESLYNSACSSQNESYFGSYNGGIDAAKSATNFNGQTVLMNASSTSLIPNTTYRIKLVIADRDDNESDSAIFLGADSFNVGQNVLGPDLTIENKTAICDTYSHKLVSKLSPSIYSFEWTFNGNPIGANTPDLVVTEPGTYGLTYTILNSNCIVTTDFIKVEFFNPIITPDPVDLYRCNSGQASFSFNLSYNTTIVGVPATQISYHASLAAAISKSNPLPSLYTVAIARLPVPIWIRISDGIGKCFITKSFELKITPPPIATKPADLFQCETTIDSNKAIFYISTQTNAILGLNDPTVFDVSYFKSISDANAGINPINSGVAYTSSGETIVAKVYNKTDPACFQTTSFNLVVLSLPSVNRIADQIVCTSYTLPTLANPGDYYSGPNRGLPMLSAGDEITTDKTIYIYFSGNVTSCFNETKFNVKIIKPEDLSKSPLPACDKYVLPKSNLGIRYFTKPGGPTTPDNTEIIGGNTTIVSSQSLYTYFESKDISDPCQMEGQIDITINTTPIIVDGPFKNEFECTSYNLKPLSLGNYYTLDTSTGTYTLAVSPITKTTKLYVYGTNGTCKSQDISFTVYIGDLVLDDKSECRSYNLPPAPVGEYRDAPDGGGNVIKPGPITTTKTIYTYIPGASCDLNKFTITINAPFLTEPSNLTLCEGDEYFLADQAEGGRYFIKSGGPEAIGNRELIPNVDIIKTRTQVFIYKPATTVNGCYNEKSFWITFNKRQPIDSRGNIGPVCNSYKLTPLKNGKYFEFPDGVGPLPDDYEVKENKTIYIYAAGVNNTTCENQSAFEVKINAVKVDAVPSQLSYCTSFTFPPLPSPDNFYYDAPGGPLGVGRIILSNTTINAPIAKTYYIYHQETSRGKVCSNENPFSILVTPRPRANVVIPLENCDTFDKNDGIFQFDLTDLSIRNQVLNGQTPDDNFTLTFFTSLADANDILAVPITDPSAYQNDIPYSDSVWIRVENNTSGVPCFDVVELKLIVKPLPIPKLLSEYFICEDYATGTLLGPVILDSGLSVANFSFAWKFNGTPLGGDTASITTTEIGDYELTITNKTSLCTKTFLSKVTKYSPYLEVNYSDAFVYPTFLKVDVLGDSSGNYEYQLDDFPFQDSNIFNNIAPGEHVIFARDKDGHCDPNPIKAIFINYPKFFTPNEDGYNETWNIKHLTLLNPNAPIHIFDRYGKFLKQISPVSEGWNGTFNGKQLPSDDYWFTVYYNEKGTSKVFKSHFTLKR